MTSSSVSKLQLLALRHLAKHEFTGASNHFDVGFYSPGQRAKPNHDDAS
jgi:hypothetical protein